MGAFVPVLLLFGSGISIDQSAIGSPDLIECVIVLGLEATGNFLGKAELFPLRFAVIGTVW